MNSDCKLLYTGYLKDQMEMCVNDDAITVLHKADRVFELDTGAVRCALPVSSDTVRIFWRSRKDDSAECQKRYRHDFRLDLKKMSRIAAAAAAAVKTRYRGREEAEAQRLSRILVEAAQKRHGITMQDVAEPLAMHAGEQTVQTWDAECRFGRGTMFLTNFGIYFVANKKGLCIDMSLDVLDSYHVDNKTVTIYYFEPQWKDGYDDASKEERKAEIRIRDGAVHAVCLSIAKVYGDSDAREARRMAVLAEQFGAMTADQMYNEYFADGKIGEMDRPVNEYVGMLAKKRWGVPTTQEVADCDAAVIRACIFTGIPADVAGEMTEADRKIREDTVEYNAKYIKYKKDFDVLRQEMIGIAAANLSDADHRKVMFQCNPYVVCDTIVEMAEKGCIAESFQPESLTEWQRFKSRVNEEIMQQQLYDLPSGIDFKWGDDIFCPWDLQDAKRIAENRDFLDICKAIKLLNERYGPIRVYSVSALFSKRFERRQKKEIALRVRRVYDHWCKTNPADTDLKDATDGRWVQHVQDRLDESRLERHQRYFGLEKTVLEEIADAHAESQNTETRLQRAIKPMGVPGCDMYEDAWHDVAKQLWFTTNPYFRISDTDMQVIGVEHCEQKFGYRAIAFSEDVVELCHGLPAIYDGDSGWWVLLCTVRDARLTAGMVDEKRVHDTLRYNVAQPAVSIADDGSIVHETDGEYILEKDDGKMGTHLPFHERVRRLIFTYTAMHAVRVTDRDRAS